MFVFFVLILIVNNVYAIRPYRRSISQVKGDYGDPVFLTKYLDKNDTEGARKASAVMPFKKDIESYAGFLTVNKEYNSNIFFWFFAAERYKEHAPVVVWLQGGPGSSSFFGLFCENGAYYFDELEKIKVRPYYWSQIANVIYIDNPVGTGFSFTDDEKGYVTDEVQVGRDLYEMIRQFFQIFPEYRKNDFFIFGESYGGKYAPAMAYTIHKNNKIKNEKIKLKGIGIGNGFTDPVNMLKYGKYLFELSIIDQNGKEKFEKLENKITNLINQGDFIQAGILINDLTDGKNSLFFNLTGYEFYFNYLYTEDYMDDNINKFLQIEEVRRSIHVGNLTFIDGSEKVMKYLSADMMKSVKPWLETLLENYRVLIYNGQLDIICAYPLTENYIRKLEWSGAEDYVKAERKKWFVDGKLAGYVKRVKSLTEVLVRNAGHMVPADQPVWALTLLQRFIYNKNF